MKMAMKINKLIIGTLFITMIPTLKAENPDFGIWIGADGEKKLTKNWDANFNLQARTFENSQSLALWLAETGMTWEACKYVDLSLMYRFIADYEDEDGVEYKHRIYGDVKGKIDINRFSLSCRARYQQQYNASKETETKETFRNKWTLTYNIKGSPISPFASAEWFAPLDDARFDIEAWRYMIGASWKINKKQSLEAGWLGERNDGESLNLNAVSLSWKQKF